MIELFGGVTNYIVEFSTLEAFGIMLIFVVIVRYLNKIKPLKHYIIITTMKMIVLLGMIILVGAWGYHQILLSGDNTVKAMLLCGMSEISNFYGTFSAVRDFIKWINADKNINDNKQDNSSNKEKRELEKQYEVMRNLTNAEMEIVMEIYNSENGYCEYSSHNINIRSLLEKDVIRCIDPLRGTPRINGYRRDYSDRLYRYEFNMWTIKILNECFREFEKNNHLNHQLHNI